MEKNYCQGIKFYTLIGADANVYPCYRAWGNKKFSYGSLLDLPFNQIWESERKAKIEKKILTSPPIADECAVCGISKLNDKLAIYYQKNKWRNFLI